MPSKEKYKFQEGEKVAHISNLKLELFINRIIFKSVKIPVLYQDKKVSEKSVSKIDSIEVSFADPETGRLHKDRFHSRLLVPWEVAKKGELTAIRWLEGNNNKAEKKKQ